MISARNGGFKYLRNIAKAGSLSATDGQKAMRKTSRKRQNPRWNFEMYDHKQPTTFKTMLTVMVVRRTIPFVFLSSVYFDLNSVYYLLSVNWLFHHLVILWKHEL